MATVFDVPADKLISAVKEDMKKVEAIKAPEWSKFVKTGKSKDKPPQQEDFWYTRAASVLRQLYVQGRPLGTQRLRTKYGSKKEANRPAHFKKGSGSIIRKILQQLEKAGFVQKTTIQGKKGRIISKKGKSYLDKFAAKLNK